MNDYDIIGKMLESSGIIHRADWNREDSAFGAEKIIKWISIPSKTSEICFVFDYYGKLQRVESYSL